MGVDTVIRAFFIGVGGAAIIWFIRTLGELLDAKRKVKVAEIEIELNKIKERDSKSSLDDLILRENQRGTDRKDQDG